MVWSDGNMSLKNPVTTPGIDPGTVRLVAQRLNHYATPGPDMTVHRINKGTSVPSLLSALNGGNWLPSYSSHLYPQEKNKKSALNRGLGGPQSPSVLLPRLEPWIIQPTTLSLYQLHNLGSQEKFQHRLLTIKLHHNPQHNSRVIMFIWRQNVSILCASV